MRPLFALLTAALLAACQNGGNVDAACTATPAIWGSGEAGLVNGSASQTRLANPATVETAPDGSVFVADFNNDTVRLIRGCVSSTLVDGSTAAPLTFQRPFGLSLGDDVLYIQTDGNDVGARDATTGTVWRYDLATGALTMLAHNLGRPRGLQALPDGRVALSDPRHHVLSILDPATGNVTPLAGTADSSGFADATGSAARFNAPYGIALGSDGALLVADFNNQRIRHVTLAGVVTTLAGSGTQGNANGAALSASFAFPEDVAVAGNAVLIADVGNHLIRRLEAGTVSTQAGDGTAGFVDAPGTSAEFFGLEGIAATADGGALWIADGTGGDDAQPYNRVRRIPLP